MAVQIRPDIYSGGAQPINLSPFMNYYVQQENKKQLREKAFNDYLQDVSKDLTPTGMRGTDISGDKENGVPGFYDLVNDIQGFGVANKKALANPTLDGGKALRELNMKINNAKGVIDLSKKAAKFDAEMAKKKQEGYELTDNDVQFLANKSRSVLDPNYDPREFDGLDVSVPPFDANQQNSFLKAASGDLKPGRVYDEANTRINKETRQSFTPFSDQFTANQLKLIGDRAGEVYDNDRSAKKYFNTVMAKPAELEELDKVYKSVYGKDAHIQSDKDVAKAWAIKQKMSPAQTGEERRVYVDPDQNYRNQLSLIHERAKSQLAVSEAKKKAAKGGNEQYIKDYMQSIINKAKSGKPVPIYYPTKDGKKTELLAYDIPVSNDLVQATIGTPANNNPRPDAFRYIPNKGIMALYFKYDKNKMKMKSKEGRTLVDEQLTKIIPFNQISANLGKYYFSTKGLPQWVNDSQIETAPLD